MVRCQTGIQSLQAEAPKSGAEGTCTVVMLSGALRCQCQPCHEVDQLGLSHDSSPFYIHSRYEILLSHP